MSKITVRRDKFNDMLNLMALKGDVENKEALIKVSKDKMEVSIVSSNNIVAGRGCFKGTFDDLGDVGIDDLLMLKSFVNSANVDTLDIDKKENKIVIKVNKTTFSCVLRNPKYIVNVIPDDKFNGLKEKCLGNEFSLSQDIIKSIISNFNLINPFSLILSGEGKNLSLKLESNQNELTVDFDSNKEVSKFTVSLAKLFIDLLSVLTGDVTISIKDGSPVYIKTAGEDYEFEFIVAPIGK